MVASNPRRRRRRRSRRNPSQAFARVVRSNPRRRRRSRRNPLPAWASIGVAALLGLGGFALASVGSFAATKQLDPQMTTLTRNRWIAGGLVGVGGVALALKSRNPMLQNAGIALAAAGAVFSAGSTVSAFVGNAIGQGMAGLGSIVNRANVPAAIAGGAFPYRRMNGGMGAVANDPGFGMGEVALATTPPWQYRTPLS